MILSESQIVYSHLNAFWNVALDKRSRVPPSSEFESSLLKHARGPPRGDPGKEQKTDQITVEFAYINLKLAGFAGVAKLIGWKMPSAT
jgi:hypothetical protein